MNYLALQYKGKTWGVYGKQCKCFIVLGNKKEIQEAVKRLNNMEVLKNE